MATSAGIAAGTSPPPTSTKPSSRPLSTAGMDTSSLFIPRRRPDNKPPRRGQPPRNGPIDRTVHGEAAGMLAHPWPTGDEMTALQVGMEDVRLHNREAQPSSSSSSSSSSSLPHPPHLSSSLPNESHLIHPPQRGHELAVDIKRRLFNDDFQPYPTHRNVKIHHHGHLHQVAGGASSRSGILTRSRASRNGMVRISEPPTTSTSFLQRQSHSIDKVHGIEEAEGEDDLVASLSPHRTSPTRVRNSIRGRGRAATPYPGDPSGRTLAPAPTPHVGWTSNGNDSTTSHQATPASHPEASVSSTTCTNTTESSTHASSSSSTSAPTSSAIPLPFHPTSTNTIEGIVSLSTSNPTSTTPTTFKPFPSSFSPSSSSTSTTTTTSATTILLSQAESSSLQRAHFLSEKAKEEERSLLRGLEMCTGLGRRLGGWEEIGSTVPPSAINKKQREVGMGMMMKKDRWVLPCDDFHHLDEIGDVDDEDDDDDDGDGDDDNGDGSLAEREMYQGNGDHEDSLLEDDEDLFHYEGEGEGDAEGDGDGDGEDTPVMKEPGSPKRRRIRIGDGQGFHHRDEEQQEEEEDWDLVYLNHGHDDDDDDDDDGDGR